MGHIVVATSAPVRLEPFIPFIRLIHSTQLWSPVQCPVNGRAHRSRLAFRLTAQCCHRLMELSYELRPTLAKENRR